MFHRISALLDFNISIPLCILSLLSNFCQNRLPDLPNALSQLSFFGMPIKINILSLFTLFFSVLKVQNTAFVFQGFSDMSRYTDSCIVVIKKILKKINKTLNRLRFLTNFTFLFFSSPFSCSFHNSCGRPWKVVIYFNTCGRPVFYSYSNGLSISLNFAYFKK